MLAGHAPWLGGAERCLLELVEGIAGAREVHVTLPSDGPLRPRLQAAGARVWRVPTGWWARDPGRRPRLPPWGAPRMARALARLRPDVVVSCTLVHPAAALAARALGLPHVWWVHEFGDRDHGFRFTLGHGRSVRLVGALSDAVVASGPAVRDALAGAVPPARLRFVPYGVGVPAVAAPPARAAASRARLVLAGRVRPSKGQREAVEAVARLTGGGVDAELEIVGDGEPRHLGELRALAARLGVADRVRLAGQVPDTRPHLDAADVVLVCSRDEAFGRVTVEAMKRGVPVVGAAAGGTAHLIAHGGTGLLYPPGDAAALARAVAGLLADAPLRHRLAAAGWRDATSTYDPAAHATAFLALLDEVAAGGRA